MIGKRLRPLLFIFANENYTLSRTVKATRFDNPVALNTKSFLAIGHIIFAFEILLMIIVFSVHCYIIISSPIIMMITWRSSSVI